MTGYDIIGDVHGCADKLVGLLQQLGYDRDGSAGPWRHPDRQAVFVGDLIDRGPGQLESVAIVRAMVEAGTAQCVIGNHEFNAVAYATKNAAGDWCRPHTDKNNGQHEAFLDAVTFGSDAHQDILGWFTSLPLWLDLGGIRVVHACWHEASIEHLRPKLSPTGGLTTQIVIDGTDEKTATYDAIETLLKGPELSLNDWHYFDKGGHPRYHGRFEWWNPHATTLREAVRIDSSWELFDEHGVRAEALPDTPIPAGGVTPYTEDVPVVFGHYWFSGDPVLQGPTTACADYSAVKGGALVAYRWDGETELDADKLVAFA